MNKRRIGKTEIEVGEIGYGSMSLSLDPERRPSEAESTTLLQRMVDELGVDFIDTADVYCAGEDEIGHSERLIASALRGERRERVTIATKGGFTRPGGAWIPDGRPEHLRAACEASLRALETDRIDLYQLHRPDPAVPFEESVRALTDMQREGKIRHIGLSNVTLTQLQGAMSIAEIVSIQNPLAVMFYNEAAGDLLRFCEEQGITWIAYAPVGGHRNAHRLAEEKEWVAGIVTSTTASPYSIVLAWLLGKSPAIIPIPATTKFEHLVENVRAADIRLTDQEMAALAQQSE